MASRPELQAPPEIFYNDGEARKYTSSSRIIDIQAKLSERALELLALPDDDIPRLLLDIGCGSGLSGETLTDNGHQWIGLDISSSMLDIALERETEGDLLLGDMGQKAKLRELRDRLSKKPTSHQSPPEQDDDDDDDKEEESTDRTESFDEESDIEDEKNSGGSSKVAPTSSKPRGRKRK